jgi:hypothetical protein
MFKRVSSASGSKPSVPGPTRRSSTACSGSMPEPTGAAPSYDAFSVIFFEAHPVVPGSAICGMRMPCGGRLRRAQEGIEWLRAIGVSTVPRWPKGRRTATGMRTSSLRHPKNRKPSPVSDFARHPYMLMNLGQRDEPFFSNGSAWKSGEVG